MKLIGRILSGNDFKLGRVTTEGDRIAAVELGKFRAVDADFFLPDCFIGPGLIDLQLNGALGKDFTAEPEAAAEVASWLPKTGVTGYLPTIITSPLERQLQSLAATAAVMRADPAGARILGIHLEGPFINPAHKGAHDPNAIRLPSVSEAQQMVKAAAGALRIVTLAPELPRADDVAYLLRKAGVIASAGHSAATYEQAMEAFKRGFGWITHVFNAQPPLHHRAPGLPGAALSRQAPPLGLIADSVHVHPAVCEIIYRSRGAQGITLVTDAMAALGLGPGRYEIGGQAVEVDATTARLAGKDTLAGSVLALNQAVANMMKFADVPRHEAWRMASTLPARLLGLEDYGELKRGAVADLLVAADDMSVVVTVRGGEEVYADYVRS